MAKIQTGDDKSILKITRWLGLNENPDGDTQLNTGEAAEMQNFKITQDGNLQLRPGMRPIHSVRAWDGPIRGVWHGLVAGAEVTAFSAGGRLWAYDFETNEAQEILHPGTVFTDESAFFFGFSEKLYIMNGREYLEWDGSLPPEGGAVRVEGYRPLVQVASPPDGGGTSLEQINKLNGRRRVWCSPDGSARLFQLPETDLGTVDYVRDIATGAEIPGYSADTAAGTVTFANAPAAETNSIEIGYTVTENFRRQAEAMRFSESYNGGTDNRVFIYGDGTNRAFYSGLDYNGTPRADYFPDLNVLDVGTANTPVTAMIRHYDRLAVFKTDSAYTVSYGAISLEDGRTTAAFYVTTVNRAVGNAAPGQVQLTLNNPRTLFSSAVYEWRNYSAYSANLTTDERQSKNISRRVFSTLGGMNLAKAFAFDDSMLQEFYIVEGGTAVVNSYATDTWFVYRDFDVTCLFRVGGDLYGATAGGDIVSISRTHTSDGGRPINAVWRSGSIALGRDWQKKYISRLFVTMKPEPKSHVTASIRTNRGAESIMKAVSQGLATLGNANFGRWSFSVNRQPQTRRFKAKAKKFAYFQLVFESNADWSAATILAADVKFRYASDVR